MAELMKAFGDGEFRLIFRIFFRNLNVQYSHAILLPWLCFIDSFLYIELHFC
jgi:hypothetical protein